MNMNDFYKKYKNKYVKTDGTTGNYVDWYGNNLYCGQCATLARLALVYIWGHTNKPYGNAKDFVHTVTGTKVSKSKMKDGDIVIWTKCGYYGHIGVAYKGKVLNQNPHKARLDNLSTYGSYVIIRPKNYKGGSTVAKNKDLVALVEYLTENGNKRRFNLYSWDKKHMTLDRGDYKYIWGINCNSRTVWGYKNGKWSKNTTWKNQRDVRVAVKVIKHY